MLLLLSLLQLRKIQGIQIATVLFIVNRRVDVINANATVQVVWVEVSDARGSSLVDGRLVVRGPDLFNHLLVVILYKLRIVIDATMRKNT